MAMQTPPMPEKAFYFSDAVVLSNFALARRLDLLVERYGQRGQITSEVLDEISEGIAAGYADLTTIEQSIASATLGSAESLSPTERTEFRALLQNLGPGEASCIVCAQSRGGTVVTDDSAARAICTERSLPLTGTIGILKACCRARTLSPHQADTILQAMIDAGYYAPVNRISTLL